MMENIFFVDVVARTALEQDLVSEREKNKRLRRELRRLNAKIASASNLIRLIQIASASKYNWLEIHHRNNTLAAENAKLREELNKNRRPVGEFDAEAYVDEFGYK